MNMTQIFDALKESNKWWKREFILEYKDRDIYKELNKYMDTGQIIVLTGLRRVGKTTLMLKLVRDLLDKGYDKENIMYFSFDGFRDIEINEVIRSYKELMEKNTEEGKYIFLFDEIQKVHGWEEQIKRIYDNHKNFKLILSGSESLFIRKKTKESLAGRFFEFKINQLNFNEFLRFKDFNVKNIKLQEEEINSFFNEYMLTSGFPEVIGHDNDFIDKYIQEGIIEKIIYRDIPQIISIDDPAILESMYKIILNDPGQIILIEELAKEQGISRQTVSSYLDYLEKSFLIKKLYNFSKNSRKTERKLKKYYPNMLTPKVISKIDPGKVLETFSALALDAEFFWRDAYKNEVDIVLNDNKVIPIEIKAGKIEAKNLKKFMKNFKLDKGYILTKEKEDEVVKDNTKIIVMPLWKWLLQN